MRPATPEPATASVARAAASRSVSADASVVASASVNADAAPSGSGSRPHNSTAIRASSSGPTRPLSHAATSSSRRDTIDWHSDIASVISDV